MTKHLYVYILRCSDNIYYTGLTHDPEKRLIEHNSGTNPKAYTFSRRPVEMVYCERFTDFHRAAVWEKRIKDWSRKKKEALIKAKWDKLKEFSECRNKTSHKNYKTLLDSARSDTNQV